MKTLLDTVEKISVTCYSDEAEDVTMVRQAVYLEDVESLLTECREQARKDVLLEADDCVISTFNELQFKDSDTQLCVKAVLGDVRAKLRDLITPEGKTALEEFGLRVAERVRHECNQAYLEQATLTNDGLLTIVKQVMEGEK